ncbi:5078_t:CDS:1, partial [Racocetra persica]
NNINLELSEQAFPDLFFHLPNISFSEAYNKVNHRKTYTTINGLFKKAIQAKLDAGSNTIQELKDFISSFITKYAPKQKDKKNKGN